MDRRTRQVFFWLIVVQAIHSVEEYWFCLYEVFPPARLASSLISNNLEVGFVAVNVAFVVFGIASYVISSRGLAWLWVMIELVNGIGHPTWAFLAGHYVPGVATAPVLFVLALYLGSCLWQDRSKSTKLPGRP